MISVAVPPLETYMLPLELTVVAEAIPPSSTVMESYELSMIPSLDSPLEMIYDNIEKAFSVSRGRAHFIFADNCAKNGMLLFCKLFVVFFTNNF